jgi:hypothetical protein
MKVALLAAALVLVVSFGCSSSSDDAGSTCPELSCGGPPPVHCANGGTATLTCVRGDNGTCNWNIDCPPTDAANDTSTASDTNDASDATDATDTTDGSDASDAVDQ